MQVHEGSFRSWLCYLCEVDWPNQSTTLAATDPDLSKEIQLNVVVEDLEWYFQVGDQVHIVIGVDKG